MESRQEVSLGHQYSLIDSGHFQKLEQVGPYRLIRPSACASWKPSAQKSEWDLAEARFERFANGKGKWTLHNGKIPESWEVEWSGVHLKVKRTAFGHLGLFAEQGNNWNQIRDHLRSGAKSTEKPKVLNLFAYTGGMSLAALQGGAEVVHVDASKVSVEWARENARLNKLESHPIRWLVDDVKSFIKKEIRRGSLYDGIILDPPSYGRGNKSQLWKIEDDLGPLLSDLDQLLREQSGFVLLSAHSPGYTPMALKNLLESQVSRLQGPCQMAEMVVEDQAGRALPSGAYCLKT